MGFRQKKLKEFIFAQMKIFLSTLILSALFFVAQAQNRLSSIDLGIYLGGSSYLGDINQNRLFYNFNPSVGGFIRYNYNSRWALRLNGQLLKIDANDLDFNNAYQQNRNEKFDTELGEVSLFVEFNFLRYHSKLKARYHKFSPYLITGFSYAQSTNTSSPLSIPMGVGFKFAVKDRLTGSVEWVMRKTFTDELDNLSDPLNTKSSSLLYNNDWYYFVGITLSYKIINIRTNCNNYELYKKKEVLKRKRNKLFKKRTKKR